MAGEKETISGEDELSQIGEAFGILAAREGVESPRKIVDKMIAELVGPRAHQTVEDITTLADRYGIDVAKIGGMPVFNDGRWNGVSKRIWLVDATTLTVQQLERNGSGRLEPGLGNNESFRLVPTSEAEATLTDEYYKIVGTAVDDVDESRKNDVARLRKYAIGDRVWVFVNNGRLSQHTLEREMVREGAGVLWRGVGSAVDEEENRVSNEDWSNKIANLAYLLGPFDKCKTVALEYLRSKVK